MSKILRFPQTFGPQGVIPVKHTKAYEDFIFRPGGPTTVTGTNLPRLRRVPLGPRAIGFLESKVVELVAGLAALSEQEPEQV
jgi:hypothetical protein